MVTHPGSCLLQQAGGSKKRGTAYRPRSAYSSQPRTASEMAEKAEVSVGELFGQDATQHQQSVNHNNNTVHTINHTRFIRITIYNLY